MKLQDLVTDYLSLRLVRPPTERTYRYYVGRVTQLTGLEVVNECTLDCAIAFRDALLATSKQVTWNSARRHLIALWKHAVCIEQAEQNPWAQLRPGQVHTKPKCVAEPDFSAALNYLAKQESRFRPIHLWQTLFMALANTGMRRSQLVGLEWRDINFKQGTILLRAATSKTYREYKVPMCDSLLEMLYQLHSDALALWGKAPDFAESQVFNIRLHRNFETQAHSLTTDAVTKFFSRLAKLSESSLSCHRLRHRIATRLLENNATHIKNVQSLLGHTNIATTLNYVSPNLPALRNAIDQLNEKKRQRR